MHHRCSRRSALGALAALPLADQDLAAAPAPDAARLAPFELDVTPRLGHPLFGGHFAPARSIDDPLYLRGVVLGGLAEPVVLAALDWLELRNDAYQSWRTALAEAAQTSPHRVLLACVHQHDAPLADLAAQRLLDEARAPIALLDLDFHERLRRRAAEAVRQATRRWQPVTHLAWGQAQVEQVASNRRVLLAGGRPGFSRLSATRDPVLRAQPDGQIDPSLKSLCFYRHDQLLATLYSYATHPMSYYGGGAVSSDFVGQARARRQHDQGPALVVYFTGCSGDITAGKYNDGAPENRARLADRVYRAMVAADERQQRAPLTRLEVRTVPVLLPHSPAEALREDALRRALADASRPPFERALAALGLSSRLRHPQGHPIELQAVDLGPVQWVLLPGESFVAFQLLAQRLRPDQFVMASGYGECSTGYVPTEAARNEGFVEEHAWCWVAPGAERLLNDALAQVLAAPAARPATSPR
jgi:hypothetical protein